MENGYFFIPGKQSSVAFFPLYPIIVRIFSFVFGNTKLTGFLISNVALLLASIYLYKLIKLDFEDSIALRTVFYMLIFPTSFFFSIFYNESFFLFLVIASFYYARKEKWLVASLFGFFVSLTKILGVFIFIPIIFEYFYRIYIENNKFDFNKIKINILYLLLIPLGLVIHMVYLFFKFGDTLAFLHTQKEGWEVHFVSIFTTLSKTLYSMLGKSLFYGFLFLGFLIFTLIIIIYLIYIKVRITYIIYCILFFFLFLSANVLESLHRYILVLFPLYLGLALITHKSKFWDNFFTLFSVMFLTLFTILFTNGYWFV